METLDNDPRLSSEGANIAYRRIDALLRAYGVQHAAIRGVHAHRILHEALEDTESEGLPLEETASRIALEEIHQSIEALAPLVAEDDEAVDMNRLLLAIKKAGIPRERPEVFLGEAKLGENDIANLRRIFKIQPAPRIRRQSMGAPALRFESIDEMAEGTSAAFGKLPLVRWFVPALGVILLVCIVYFFAK